jgi:hypothetical protein
MRPAAWAQARSCHRVGSRGVHSAVDARIEFEDRSTWLFYLILPLVFTTLLGLSFTAGGNVVLLVVDNDDEPVAAQLIAALGDDRGLAPRSPSRRLPRRPWRGQTRRRFSRSPPRSATGSWPASSRSSLSRSDRRARRLPRRKPLVEAAVEEQADSLLARDAMDRLAVSR